MIVLEKCINNDNKIMSYMNNDGVLLFKTNLKVPHHTQSSSFVIASVLGLICHSFDFA